MDFKNKTYQEAFDALQDIEQYLETEVVPIDVLEEKIREAVGLIDCCKQKLRNTELLLNHLLSEDDEDEYEYEDTLNDGSEDEPEDREKKM